MGTTRIVSASAWSTLPRFRIDCRGASVAEVEEREAALRRVVDVHPNHPTLEVTRYEEEEMISDAQNQEVR